MSTKREYPQNGDIHRKGNITGNKVSRKGVFTRSEQQRLTGRQQIKVKR
jgi:hypothetical protein